MTINKEELRELRVKLDGLDLSEEQRRLLDEIVRIAWVVADQGDALDAQFDDSFEPGEAAAIMTGGDFAQQDDSGIRDAKRP